MRFSVLNLKCKLFLHTRPSDEIFINLFHRVSPVGNIIQRGKPQKQGYKKNHDTCPFGCGLIWIAPYEMRGLWKRENERRYLSRWDLFLWDLFLWDLSLWEVFKVKFEVLIRLEKRARRPLAYHRDIKSPVKGDIMVEKKATNHISPSGATLW